jgi:rhamnosyltransferase
MNRVAIFAHFDRQNEVKPYVQFYLERLREVCSRVVFVSTARLPPSGIERLRPYADQILLRENVGWDFGMWKHALEHTDLSGSEELVLTNSSLFGPVYPLGPIFEQMSAKPCDFWGMTDNFEIRWHLQSYFLVFKRNVTHSDSFRLFWNSVLPYRNKSAIVSSYELGLTSFLVDSGFQPGAFLPTEAWSSWLWRRRMDLERRWNPTLFYPEKLLSFGMPFVKVMLLRDNVGDVRLDPVYEGMSRAGYDMSLVAFDRAPTERDRKLRARARRLWSRVAEYSEGSSQLVELNPPPSRGTSAPGP